MHLSHELANEQREFHRTREVINREVDWFAKLVKEQLIAETGSRGWLSGNHVYSAQCLGEVARELEHAGYDPSKMDTKEQLRKAVTAGVLALVSAGNARDQEERNNGRIQ